MGKKALVISGGGCKGAFAVGVVNYLAANFPQINFDILVGTSTGSLIIPLVATGEIDLLKKLYTTVTTADIIEKGNIVTRLLSDDSFYNADPVVNLLNNYYNDQRSNTILGLSKEVFFATTCLQSGKAVFFSTKNPPPTDYEILRINNPDEFRRSVMASACQPVFMPPIEVHKGKLPIRQYVDGGVREYAGIQMAIDAGAEEIYTILLTPRKEAVEEKTFADTFSILEKTIDIFTAGVGIYNLSLPLLYNRALNYIQAVKDKMKADGISQAKIDSYFSIPLSNSFTGKKPLKIYVIRPDAPLGGGPGGLNFDPTEMKGMLAKGENKMSDFMAHLPPHGSDVA